MRLPGERFRKRAETATDRYGRFAPGARPLRSDPARPPPGAASPDVRRRRQRPRGGRFDPRRTLPAPVPRPPRSRSERFASGWERSAPRRGRFAPGHGRFASRGEPLTLWGEPPASRSEPPKSRSEPLVPRSEPPTYRGEPLVPRREPPDPRGESTASGRQRLASQGQPPASGRQRLASRGQPPAPRCQRLAWRGQPPAPRCAPLPGVRRPLGARSRPLARESTRGTPVSGPFAADRKTPVPGSQPPNLPTAHNRPRGGSPAWSRQSHRNGCLRPPDLTPRPPLPSPLLPPGEGAPPPKGLKMRGKGVPLYALT